MDSTTGQDLPPVTNTKINPDMVRVNEEYQQDRDVLNIQQLVDALEKVSKMTNIIDVNKNLVTAVRIISERIVEREKGTTK